MQLFSLAWLQVASEKDLEAVMAIDKFRGVELRKLLTEVRAAEVRASFRQLHTIWATGMHVPQQITTTVYRSWTGLAALLLRRLHALSSLTPLLPCRSAASSPANASTSTIAPRHGDSWTCWRATGAPGSASSPWATRPRAPRCSTASRPGWCASCLGLLGLPAAGPMRGAKLSDRCRAHCLFALTSPASRGIPSRDRFSFWSHLAWGVQCCRLSSA